MVLSIADALALAVELPWHRVRWWAENRHNDTYAVNRFNRRKVRVGRFSYGPIEVYEYGALEESLAIGALVSIGPNVRFLLGGNHYYHGFTTFPLRAKILHLESEAVSRGPIRVEDDVWIGMGTVILSGVTIGKGSVIGAYSVVSRDIPPFSIAVGSPARIIKARFPPEVQEALLALDYSRLDRASLERVASFNYEPLKPE